MKFKEDIFEESVHSQLSKILTRIDNKNIEYKKQKQILQGLLEHIQDFISEFTYEDRMVGCGVECDGDCENCEGVEE